jgi:hypothetical protein
MFSANAPFSPMPLEYCEAVCLMRLADISYDEAIARVRAGFDWLALA